MRRLDEICLDLKEVLSEHFATVRITSAQVSEQFLLELKAIHPAKLPAVVIVFEQGTFTAENSIRESRLSLVLLDAFTAGSQARSLSVFEEFEKLLADGTPVSVPAGKDYDMPASVTEPVIIKGGENSSVTFPATTGDSDGGYNLPEDSKLENITVKFSSATTKAAGRADGVDEGTTDPEPRFALVLSGDTEISNVVFDFNGVDLSGICIWDAKNVTISDVTFKGTPERAPFNISGSTVKFSGKIEAENGSGWYEGDGVTVIQINGVGPNHKPSNVTFSKVTGIDAVWQEVIATDYATADKVDWKKPSGSTVSGLSDFYCIYSNRPETEGTEGTAGWMWMSEDYFMQMAPMVVSSLAHDRFFNSLNGDSNYEGMNVIERPSALADDLTYTFSLEDYQYLKDANGFATSNGNMSVTFSGEKKTDNGTETVEATNWSMTGEVYLTISDASFGTAKIAVKMNDFSGIFSNSVVGTTSNHVKFIVNSEKDNIVWADIEKNETAAGNNPAFTLATGLTGSVSVNGVSVSAAKIMEVVNKLAQSLNP